MFRRFSLFDDSPPSPKISINPPKTYKNGKKTPLKCAMINIAQLENSGSLKVSSKDEKRSKSLDHSSNLKWIHNQTCAKQRAKSATLPPILNRQLPQPSPTSHRWYTRLGNSFRRGAFRKQLGQYQVCVIYSKS
jgi:hypothetical protein